MDILIKNGLIVDGKGTPRFKSDIAINKGVISEIDQNIESDDNKCKMIDASNLIISPGFIDMHSHADLTILQRNKSEAYIMQGVTTLNVGMCGIGLAPANEMVRKYYSNFVVNMFGSNKLQLYDTLQEFMELIEKKGISPNLAFFIPHGNIRASVLGMEDRSATIEELESMKNIIRREMEAGAFGLSTGLIYPPGIITPTEELIELAKIVNEYNGIYDSHMRNEGTGVVDKGMAELIKIAKDANIQAQISHWKASGNFAWNLTSEMINLMIKSREEGINVYADIYPYESSSTSLSGMLLKPWVYADFKGNLSNAKIRKKIIDEIINNLLSNFVTDISEGISEEELIQGIISYLMRNTTIISVRYNKEVEGAKLEKILKSLYPNRSPFDALLDFVRDEEGSIMVSMKMMSERKSILHLYQQDFVCIGSDGIIPIEGNTHPRAYGTFPKILGRYVREKKLVTLEEAIRKMTSLPASILHLKDRGIIKAGYNADLVIFNPETIIDKATYKNGCQFPEGIDYVIVNGEITVEKGKHIGTLNGQILKHK
jgi:N-acyl-D-amino-acid deacylase